MSNSSVELKPYQREFLRFAIGAEVLTFGSFELKSGRTSPYFYNAGLFNTGKQLAQLGEYYAAAIADQAPRADLLFGPAYKGIPIAAATSIALANKHDLDLNYAFNRKEVKNHGEGGSIVGAPLAGRILIIDDVITALLQAGNAVGLSDSIFNIASGHPTTVAEIARRVAAMSDAPCSVETGIREDRSDEIYEMSANIGLAENSLGWRPQISLAQGLQKTWDWFAQQPADATN